jgi:ABC-type proline/glycine betaine transport system ATPase subunit
MTRSERRISMRLIAVLAGTCALALTACSSSSSSSSSSASSNAASSSASTASKVTLVVYSAQGYDSAMTKAFTKATGIPVKLDDNSSSGSPRGGLSGGEQQRVALGRALIADTGLILCDEPLSNLDADLRERMRVEISALVREAAATTVPVEP